MCRKIFYASDFAKLDSNVITGGGTDDTEALQAVLDKALELGRVHLIMDGAALIRGLKVHSNTTIECMDKSCGFFLADNSNCAVITNYLPSASEIKTENISLIGGTYNHNCLHQEHDVATTNTELMIESDNDRHWVVSVEFIGIRNLFVNNLTVRDQRTFAFTVGNFEHIHIENTYIELENEIRYGNQDGFHFWGPGRFLTMRNVGGKTEDDFMNIGPDERDKVSSITDVSIDGVILDSAWQGIRLLSRGTGRLDRVSIRNVTGTYHSYGFYINPWFIDDTMGNFGSIVFENIDLRPNYNILSEVAHRNPPFLFSIGGDIDSLTFRNIRWDNPIDNRSIFFLGHPFYDFYRSLSEGRIPRIKVLTIDGLQITDLENIADGAEYITAQGIIDKLIIRDVDILKGNNIEDKSKFFITREEAKIGSVLFDRVFAENIDTLLDLSKGEIDKLIVNNIISDNINKLIADDGVKEKKNFNA